MDVFSTGWSDTFNLTTYSKTTCLVRPLFAAELVSNHRLRFLIISCESVFCWYTHFVGQEVPLVSATNKISNNTGAVNTGAGY